MSSQIIPVPPFDYVVFGGNGDLAERKLMPALYHRDRDGQIPDEARIIGASRTAFSDDDYRGFAREALGRNMTEQEVRAAARLDPSGVARYVKTGGGRIITDDNQLLAYGAFGAVLKFRDANQPRR